MSEMEKITEELLREYEKPPRVRPARFDRSKRFTREKKNKIILKCG